MMLVYRLSQKKYSQDLNGTGAFLYGGRWNHAETYMLYTAQHISLSVLEILVHIKISSFEVPYSLITFQLPEIKYKEILSDKLKKNWDTDMEYTQQIGNDFLQNNAFLYMMIPSIVIPQEKNILINPLHPDAKKIKIIKTEDFKFDKRLLLQ
jgi:RES domain-containing protein